MRKLCCDVCGDSIPYSAQDDAPIEPRNGGAFFLANDEFISPLCLLCHGGLGEALEALADRSVAS